MNKQQARYRANLIPIMKESEEGVTLPERVKWLYKHADITPPTAYKWLAGDVMSFDGAVLLRLCEALGCTPNDILLADEVENASI